jgi:hypothetical protein
MKNVSPFRRECFQTFFSSIFVFHLFYLSCDTLLSIFSDDDDGNSHLHICASFTVVFFLILIALFITGGLFDDIQESEFIFKYAVRKTQDEQMFNASMRRLDGGNVKRND